MGIDDFVSSNDVKLDKLLKFTVEIDKMTAVLRRNVLIDKSRRENDAEHSWHIAVMALLFQEYATQKPDIGRAACMCVVHDLVEIYAGDTFAYDVEGNTGKAEREKIAADKLFALLPEEHGTLIRKLWEEFDAMETADSRYAACLDRIQPFLHNTLTDGHTWVLAGADCNAVRKRMEPVKLYMPRVYDWIEDNISNAVKKGWLSQ